MTGTYHSAHDTCIRRVFYHTTGSGKQAVKTLYVARTRPGHPEEEPYTLEPDYLNRLLLFGCWIKLDSHAL